MGTTGKTPFHRRNGCFHLDGGAGARTHEWDTHPAHGRVTTELTLVDVSIDLTDPAADVISGTPRRLTYT